MLDEHKAFAILEQLNAREKYIPGYWAAEAIALATDAHVFNELLRQQDPEVADFLGVCVCARLGVVVVVVIVVVVVYLFTCTCSICALSVSFICYLSHLISYHYVSCKICVSQHVLSKMVRWLVCACVAI